MDIQPIETRYKGYRFRSRLEARWAVFFDTLGIEWEYEKEGYDLGESGWYLPDFWLPKQNIFAEIKPYTPDAKAWMVFQELDTPAINKMIGLSAITGAGVILLDSDLATLCYRKSYDYQVMKGYLFVFPDGYIDCSYEWTVCPICGAVDATYEGKKDRIYCGHEEWRGDWCAVEKAYITARSARFEHGESWVS